MLIYLKDRFILCLPTKNIRLINRLFHCPVFGGHRQVLSSTSKIVHSFFINKALPLFLSVPVRGNIFSEKVRQIFKMHKKAVWKTTRVYSNSPRAINDYYKKNHHDPCGINPRNRNRIFFESFLAFFPGQSNRLGRHRPRLVFQHTKYDLYGSFPFWIDGMDCF